MEGSGNVAVLLNPHLQGESDGSRRDVGLQTFAPNALKHRESDINQTGKEANTQ